ncbi:MAG: divergent polysaccharide deacetylase family protein [Candidatus Eisenbacteria bacterium]|uniref:Divergent polysaccharide deacetylase family protein n=1 Tax=Eiseniibacteriota bacterium TaxID=2212470 RepID=A0A849SFP6_UNCEI|nr:divergent polysaccharide deacetylase family protein [Candidatus Eisenbacteria bacterium]
MARSRRKRLPVLPMLGILVLGALVTFAGGELLQMARSDTGQVRMARTLGIADGPRLTAVIGRQVRHALDESGMPAESLVVSVVEDGPAAVRWRVGLRSDASLLQLNYAITRTLEQAGASVLSGREGVTSRGATYVTLLAGIPGRPTHELVLARPPREEEPEERPNARLALVLYGFGDETVLAESLMVLPAPFAVAIVPGARGSAAMFGAAHHASREVVLQLPLEPVNYPQVNPGPGTLLVTMRPARVQSGVRHYIDQARPVAAVANHMGSLATQDMTLMTAVYDELRDRRLPFLHVMPAAGAVCRSLASEMGVVYDEPDETLDYEPRAADTRALDKRWKQVLEEARRRGRMMVWVRATPTTARWLRRASLPKQLEGVDLVPLTSVLRKPSPA